MQIDPQLILLARVALTSCGHNLMALLCLAQFQIQANPSQSVLTLEGEDVGELERVMQHITYRNSRQFPTPGIRRLKLSSTAT